ncbi:Adenine phosphoribosyltransferase 1 [Citrus sinensis]|uniref:Adenine phosphoribosyltransferase 1 n=2 Tax=Citrus sinensis TaxID=2711 RepID=A0ACB8KMW8_CITSI|nr:Adenine phosphoribosyltransferase 1 [Citrus sinensis]
MQPGFSILCFQASADLPFLVFYQRKGVMHAAASLLNSSNLSLRFASQTQTRLSPWIAAPSSVRLPLNRSQNYRIALPPLHSTVSGDSTQPQQMASADVKAQDPRIAGISSAIRVIPDFPKPGIMFQDITTLLLDTKAFRDTIDLFVERYKDKNISVVAGIEARGFIFGPPIALAIGAKFVPMRKPKKLPGEVISEEYSLEYGKDVMEMHVGAVQAGERALIVDDLVATGGTLSAAIRLLGTSLLEYQSVKSGFVICMVEQMESNVMESFTIWN